MRPANPSSNRIFFERPVVVDPVSPAGTSTPWLRFVLAMAWTVVTLVGCVSPATRLDQEAARLGFTREMVQGSGFQHVIFRKEGASLRNTMHVYLGGDGSPWIRGRWAAKDPTPRNPLMLRLMALDPADSVYLGRPCYHGLASLPPCGPRLWTSERYSEQVVDSMELALRSVFERTNVPYLALFGYSGGGTLAMLLAERLPETRMVVTIAGNLDPDAWARHHGYVLLHGSLSPARRPPLRPAVAQYHLAGTQDKVVPPELLQPVVDNQPNARFLPMKGFDHACCWERAWPPFLKELAAWDDT